MQSFTHKPTTILQLELALNSPRINLNSVMERDEKLVGLLVIYFHWPTDCTPNSTTTVQGWWVGGRGGRGVWW